MAYAFFDRIGFQPIAETSTTQRHPLGSRVRAVDPVYGEAEFIYLKGVASTVVGSCVAYDPKGATSALTVVATKGPCAVAMAATVAGLFGWYAVAGAVPVVAGAAAAGAIPYTSAVGGSLTNAVTANSGIVGAVFLGAPSGGLADILLDHPSIGGL